MRDYEKKQAGDQDDDDVVISRQQRRFAKRNNLELPKNRYQIAEEKKIMNLIDNVAGVMAKSQPG